MDIFKKRWTKTVLIVGGLLLVYLITRLTNLTALPIFTDEAIYIRWSQIGSRDASWRFISLVDGKQPLFTWIMMILLRFIDHPLVAGRLVSVIAGLGSVTGLWMVAQELFKKRSIAYVASLLYIVSPFGLMYDRMALYDSLSAAISIWSLYLAILLVRRVRLDIALLLGMMLGFGTLNKTSGFLSLYMLPGTLVLFDWSKRSRLLRWIGLAIVTAGVAFAMYSILRLSPLFAMIGQKDNVFVYSFSEWLTHPFNFLIGNLRGLFDWAVGYLTWPVFYSAILTGITLWKYPREKLLLMGWWFAPFFALALDGRVLYPRFILFMVLPLFVLSAVGVVWVWERLRRSIWRWVAIGILVSGSLYTDYYIITSPLWAPIPNADAGQYIDGWPSGWGIPEVTSYIENVAKTQTVSVYTDGTFGLLPYALEIALVDNPNVSIHGVYPIGSDMPKEMMRDAATHTTLVLFNQVQTIPDWPLRFIAQYQKGKRTDVFMRLYEVELPATMSASGKAR